MGFDPRQWSAPPREAQRVTGSLEALLVDNAMLRREVQQLRQRLAALERQARVASARSRHDPEPISSPPRVSAEQVRRWGESLSRQEGWTELRAGAEGQGLQGLLDDLHRRSFNPQLSLEERLNRLAPGLGSDLQQALSGPRTKKRLAVLAAFALYGVSALEWLEDDPRRVVAELRQRVHRLDQQRSRRGSGRRTRTDHRSTDQRSSDQHNTNQRNTKQRSTGHRGPEAAPAGADPRRVEAYRVLGLAWGASRDAIKSAHRRLVKQHHPDLGGRPEDFHRVNEAYQLLVA